MRGQELSKKPKVNRPPTIQSGPPQLWTARGVSGRRSLAKDKYPAGWRANFYPTGLNDSVVASAYEPSVPL